MTRLGWWLLIGFALAIGLFALVVYRGGDIPRVAWRQKPVFVPRNTQGGPLLIPVAGVRPDRLRDTWGDARGGGTRAHHAIDIMATRGTPVIAAAAGTIEKVFESRDGGHTVYVRPDPSTIHYYAHLESYAPDLREGIMIRRGQPLGTVGASGDASADGPHLHFEIKRMAPGERWWQGMEIDPYPILAGKPAAR